MPRRTIYVSDYETAVRQGRSQGTGSSYTPGLFVRDTASQATCTRLWSPKLGRLVQLLSHGEVNAFLQLEWLSTVIDIREQFFLDPLVTKSICKQLHLVHPNVKGRDIVMTTDFVVTRHKEGRVYFEAYQVKRSPADLTPRTRAKLKVESLYWETQGVNWGVLYSEQFNAVQCNNLTRLHVWQGEKPTPADARTLAEAFCRARRSFAQSRPSEVPLGVRLEDGRTLNFLEVMMMLTALHFVEFPLREVDITQCPVGLFTEAVHV